MWNSFIKINVTQRRLFVEGGTKILLNALKEKTNKSLRSISSFVLVLKCLIIYLDIVNLVGSREELTKLFMLDICYLNRL